MLKYFRRILPIYILIDIITIASINYLSYIFKYNSLARIFTNIYLPQGDRYAVIMAFWVISTIIIFYIRNLYTTDREITMPREVLRVISSLLCAAVLVGAVIFFDKYKFYSREVFLRSFILFCIFLSGWRIIKRLIVRRLISEGYHNMNILIVGAGDMGKEVLSEIRAHPYWGLNAVGFLDDKKSSSTDSLPVLGNFEDFTEVTKKHFIDEVIVTIPAAKEIVNRLVKQAKKLNLSLRVILENLEEPLSPADITYLGITPLLTYKERIRHPAEFALKRLFDVVVSLILLVFIFPLFLLIALLIKFNSSGPIFYVQKRSGYKGKEFYFYKFRSMVKDADALKSGLKDRNESKGNIIFKIKGDPRVTGIGRFLRKHSMDELTQLFNVLKGDMSLVGPRPFPVEESNKIDHNCLKRLTIRPGITGLAQIRGRSNLSFYKWVKWDLWYMDNWSFWLDLMILWRTIPVILRGKGAY